VVQIPARFNAAFAADDILSASQMCASCRISNSVWQRTAYRFDMVLEHP
jgi:hypothetical protein